MCNHTDQLSGPSAAPAILGFIADEIAAAFLIPPATIAKHLVRATMFRLPIKMGP